MTMRETFGGRGVLGEGRGLIKYSGPGEKKNDDADSRRRRRGFLPAVSRCKTRNLRSLKRVTRRARFQESTFEEATFSPRTVFVVVNDGCAVDRPRATPV